MLKEKKKLPDKKVGGFKMLAHNARGFSELNIPPFVAFCFGAADVFPWRGLTM
jgi:hypothetical protein